MVLLTDSRSHVDVVALLFVVVIDCCFVSVTVLVALSLLSFFFFFQAEDGIRDHCVTGVQTCALPISPLARSTPPRASLSSNIPMLSSTWFGPAWPSTASIPKTNFATWASWTFVPRSEERRVGKESRSQW